MTIKIDENLQKVVTVFKLTGNYATTGHLVKETGLSRPTVTKRLDRLDSANCTEYVHESTGFRRLVRDPRDDKTMEVAGDTNANVASARSLLNDFEEASLEEQHGILAHAISELENAQRNLQNNG